MGLKAPSKLGTNPSRFTRLPNKFSRLGTVTQNPPSTGTTSATIKLVATCVAAGVQILNRNASIGFNLAASAVPASPYSAKALVTCGCTVSASVVNEASAAVDVAIDTAASGGLVRNASAAVGVEITSGCTGVSLITQTGSASITVDITSDCTGETRSIQQGSASVSVGITAVAEGAIGTTFIGTADISVGITADASGYNTSTTIPDETSNGNNMVMSGAAWTFVGDAAVGNRAVNFTGAGGNYGTIDESYLSVLRSPWSFSCWYKPSEGNITGNYYPTLINTAANGTYGGGYYQMYHAGRTLRWQSVINFSGAFTQRDTSSDVFSSGSGNDWKHIIVTLDNYGDPTMYINGSEVTLTTDSTPNTSDISNYSNTSDIRVGTVSSGSNIDYKIDDISLWSTQLSSTQVSNLYNSGSGTDLAGSSDLEGWWKMGDSNNASVTHTGTADCQVNIDIAASGLTSNQIPDETANANHMTLYGNASLSTDAVIGTQAIAFDGSSGYGVINDTFQSTFQSPFSISMWLKPDDGRDSYQRALFRNYESTENDYIVYEMQSGKLRFYITDDSASAARGYETTSAVFSDGAQSSYTHAIVTVDSTATPIIYIDGSSVGLTQTHSNAISLSNYAGIGNAVISGYSAAAPHYGTKFKGRVDDVSIWSTELSSTDVTNLYNSGNGTDLTGSSNLAGWWKMGEGSTATIVHTGTATISASITASATGASVAGAFSISTFNTEANILALTPANGTIAFGTDTNNYYVYDSSLGWATFTP